MDYKRYTVYYWDRRDQKSFMDDYDIELSDYLDKNIFDVKDYGTLLGTFDTEDEANDCASKQMNIGSYYDLICIWDSSERCWFN